MSLKIDNSKFLHTIQTNVGSVEFIKVQRTKVPTGIKKPYEYLVARSQFDSQYQNIKQYLKTIESELQCAFVQMKPVTYGAKFEVFLLGYNVGLTGDNTGVTQKKWETIIKKTKALIRKLLGSDAKMYIEPFSTKVKFQAQFETYIQWK